MHTGVAALPTKAGGRKVGPPVKASGSSLSTFAGIIAVDEWINLTVAGLDEADGEFGPQLVWLLTVDGQESAGVVAFYTTTSQYDGSGKMPQPSKYFAIHEAIGAKMPPVNEQTDEDVVKGGKLKAMFEIKKGKKYATIARVKSRA